MKDKAEYIIAAALIRGYVARTRPVLKWRVGGWRYYESIPLGYGDTDGRYGYEPPHMVIDRCMGLAFQLMRSGQRATFETTDNRVDVVASIEIDGRGVRGGFIPAVPKEKIGIAHELNTNGAGPALVREMDRVMRILTGCEPCQAAVYGPDGQITLASDDAGVIGAFARLIEVPTGVDLALEVDYGGTWLLIESSGGINMITVTLDKEFKHEN